MVVGWVAPTSGPDGRTLPCLRNAVWSGPIEKGRDMNTDVHQIITVGHCQWQGQLPFQQLASQNADGESPFWRSRIGLYESREFDLTSLFHYVTNGFTWATLLAERIRQDDDALIDAVEFALCLDQFQDDFAEDYNEARWEHFETNWPLPSEPVKVFGEYRTCALAGAKVFLTVVWASACNSGDFDFTLDPDCEVWPPDERVIAWQEAFRLRLADFAAKWPDEALASEYNRIATLMKQEYRQYQRQEEAAAKRKPRDAKPDEVLPGEARALAILTAHPDWTDKRIARKAGLHEKTLYKYSRYKTARQMLKDSGHAGLPRGFKTEDGDIEAYE